MKIKQIHLQIRLLAVSLAVAWSLESPCRALNIVGYANVTMPIGYRFVANPLNNANNSLTNIVLAPDDTRVFVWDVTNQVFLPTATMVAGQWLDDNLQPVNYDFPVGRGFILHSSTVWTNTFVGEVLQFTNFTYIAGFNRISLVGSKVPNAGNISSSTLTFPTLDGVDVHMFRPSTQSYSDAYTCFTNYGWFDPKGLEGTNGPTCQIGESFVVRNPGPPTNWVQVFTVAPLNSATASFAVGTQPSPNIIQLQIKGSSVTLLTDAAAGQHYNVQFSTDRVNWSTIATNQTGTAWSGNLPGGPRGFFQLQTP